MFLDELHTHMSMKFMFVRLVNGNRDPLTDQSLCRYRHGHAASVGKTNPQAVSRLSVP